MRGIEIPKIRVDMVLRCACELPDPMLKRLQILHEENMSESQGFLTEYRIFLADMEKVGLGIDAELFRRAGTSTYEFKPEDPKDE